MSRGVGASILAATILIAAATARVTAQQPSSSNTTSPSESSDATGAPFSLVTEGIVLPSPENIHLGVLTLAPPGPHEIVSVRVPIGELGMRVARTIATAYHRRAEKAAREEVARALAAFERSQPRE